MTKPAAAERTVRVAPERLERWLAGFAVRHGALTPTTSDDTLVLTAEDGARAEVELLWGPLPGIGDPREEAVAAFLHPRRIGVLLARRKAHAVGIFEGPVLLVGHAGSHYVQGRTKAGGWSQQRYARRREHQAERSFAKASADVERLLLPQAASLEAVVFGGDGAAIAAVLADERFAPLRQDALRRGLPVFAVPDPNARILAGFAEVFRAVPIRLNDKA